MKKIIGPALVVLLLGSIFYFRENRNNPDPENYKIPKHKKTMKERYLGPKSNLWEIRAFPNNDIDISAYRKGQKQANILKQDLLNKRDVKSWELVGPTNVGGRISDLQIDKNNENIIWAGTASGGVWKSLDKGQTWNPVFDDVSIMTIGAIALDPNDSDVCYAGTGEASASSFSFYGNGIYKTTDGGLTWEHIGLENSSYISRLRVDPNNSQIVWAAATGKLYSTDENRGIYKSVDGGLTWEKKLYIADNTAANDIVIDPTNSNIIYASMWERLRTLDDRISGGVNSGIWKSVDGGENWVRLTNGFPTGETIGRIGLAISKNNPSTLYSVYADYTNNGSNLGGVYKTTNGGESWQKLNTPSSMDDIYFWFGWYFSKIEVDPKDDNRVFVLGVSYWRSEDGGSSWEEMGGYGFGPHVDHHAMEISPTSTFFVEGNDGGIALSNDYGYTWEEIDFPITQFYGIEVDNNNPNTIMGGAQDNGTWITKDGSLDNWQFILGGDGFRCRINSENSNIIFAESQNGAMYKSVDGGSQFFSIFDDIYGERFDWNTPMEFDPSDNNIIYCGSQYLYRSEDGGSSNYDDFTWERVSPDLTDGTGSIYAIGVSESDGDVIYVGTTRSKVWVTKDGGGSWNEISENLPFRAVSSIAVDKNNPAIAYVTFSGLRWDNELRYVFKTENYGETWSDISSNLPDLPINDIILDNNNNGHIYVSSDIGVYHTINDGEEWSSIGLGLPNAPVHELKLHYGTNTLYAGTYGRSVYKINVNEIVDTDENEPKTSIIVGNYPNPFNNQTTINFELPKKTAVKVKLFNASGREVAIIYNGVTDKETINFDAGNMKLSSGVYIIRVESDLGIKTHKINYIK
ncbi:MAG: hypothetical protein CR982_10390 [Candidatus Cloacimonadota bacterium]|nr:MAG: hypothetical protein CR982_10390 [Candidatus Cloacimonadota bacterium]PIE79715.1 MAG: hypothetical protein CSA15_02760 [Candidatus Delongbacteria bacterium]